MKTLIIRKIINLFDSYNQSKILNVLKKHIKDNNNIFIDVGAHHGETINFYLKNFKVNKIYAFEPSIKNFEKLKKNIDNLSNKEKLSIEIFNIGLGNETKIMKLNQMDESSSSTLVKIDINSTYFKKKTKVLNLFLKSKKKPFTETDVKIDTLDNFIVDKKLNHINLIKTDTEGFEYEVIKGLKNNINKVQLIHFEHHFDNMLIKNYKFSNIHKYLTENKFQKILKFKMFFRKTFEYIYLNTEFK